MEFGRALPAVLITSRLLCSVNRLQRVQTTPLFPSTDCSLVVDVTVEKPAGLEFEVAHHFCAKLPLADLARWEETAPHLGAATRKAPLVVQANFDAAMPVRPFPRPARRARAVSADHRALGSHPPSTEARSKRPLQLLRLLRTSRWRLVEVMPQYVCQPHQPLLPGSHRRSPLPPGFLHRCARLARTHAQLAAGCAVGQAGDEAATAATANDAPSTTAQVPAAQDSPGYAAPRARTRHAVCPQA